MTFCKATSGFLLKWCLRNKHRNSILVTGHYMILVVLLTGWSKFPLQHKQQRHEITMKFLRLLLRRYFVGKSVGVLWNVSSFLFCFCCGTQKNAMWYKIGTNYPLKHQVRCRVVNYAILKGHSKVTAYKNAYHLVPQMELYWRRAA